MTLMRILFTQDRMPTLKQWFENPDEVCYRGIYDNSNNLHSYQF